MGVGDGKSLPCSLSSALVAVPQIQISLSHFGKERGGRLKQLWLL